MCHFSVKAHSGEITLKQIRETLQRPIDRVFTLVRPAGELHLSAYMQNIADEDYPYHFGTREEVLASNIDVLAEHFLSINWEVYPHLQISRNQREIADYCGVEYEIDEETLHGGRIYRGHHQDERVTVAVAGVGLLDRFAHFKRLLRHSGLPIYLRSQLRNQVDSNRGQSKW